MTQKQKKVLILIGIIAVILLVAFTVTFTEKGFYAYYQLKTEKEQLENQIDSLKNTNDSLRKEIKLLQNSDEKIEKVAREKYGMIKPGEKVYKFE